MTSGYDKNEILIKMDKSLSSFKKDLGTIRTGRANPSMLDLISIEAYGKKMPINQLGTITVPEPRSITSNLGINPQIDGQTLRIHIPQLTEERRLELVKSLKSLGEKAKISTRNIRRESNDNVKKLLKEKKISEDESKNYEKEVQKITDLNIEKIDKILSEKEKEILNQ